TRYFGDGDKVFALKPELVFELERKAGAGIGALYAKFMGAQFHFTDILEIIRLGLIGGGMSPADAQIQIDTYAKPRPILETYPLAFDILETLWSGNPEPLPAIDEVAA
ncbi:gene transfer agent family protein, partial [Mesorhizobium sp. A623]